MRLRDSGQEKDIEGAKKVCDKFGVKHIVLDLRKEFKCHVTDYFVNTYLDVRTPNPCVECNKFIKSKALMDEADKEGCDYLSTGHYARIINDENGYHLLRAVDLRRDQSYFLYPFKKEYLKRVLFPLGSFISKAEVRQIAREEGLEIAEKHDSQDVCFIPGGDYISYIKDYGINISTPSLDTPGDIIYKGKVVGTHKGLTHYTIGQRSGLGVSVGHPIYVVKLDKETNNVIVGEREDLFSKTLTIDNVNMIEDTRDEFKCMVKIRSVTPPSSAVAKKNTDGTITITFDEGVSAITSGQSAVMYDSHLGNDNFIVLGGGVIT